MADEALTDDRSETIAEFCARERISKATFFKLQRTGLAPETVRFFNIVRITADSRRRWHRRIAELSQSDAAALEQQRRVQLASRAGQAAAKSPQHVSKHRRTT